MNTKYTMIGTCTLHYLLVDKIFSKYILNLVFYKNMTTLLALTPALLNQ